MGGRAGIFGRDGIGKSVRQGLWGEALWGEAAGWAKPSLIGGRA